MTKIRLAVVTSHPIQYYAPIFRRLDKILDLEVLYTHRATPADQAQAGFGTAFDWDVDLLSGYRSRFLCNVAKHPGTSRFFGCDTPEIIPIIRAGHFDAVLVLGWYLKSFVQAIVAAKHARVPVLVRGDSQVGLRTSRMQSFVKSLVYPFAFRVFDAALYVGQRSRDYFEHYGYPDERLFHSPHCVDTDWFAERATIAAGAALRQSAGIGPDEKVVLFAGKLVAFKRPIDVINAADALIGKGRPVTVMVAGAGPLEDDMRRRASERGVRLVMLGFRNQTEMPACYAASDVLVLPSTRRETWGLVVNEALACGCPIIVSDAVGCAPDLAADGVVGRMYPLGDTRRLVDAIADVVDNPPPAGSIRGWSNASTIDAACLGIISALARVTANGDASGAGRPITQEVVPGSLSHHVENSRST
jgi:glycosyltransferase involved in cell wall biosynthesis